MDFSLQGYATVLLILLLSQGSRAWVVNGVTVATGTGPRRNLARDAAATAALEVLKAQEEA